MSEVPPIAGLERAYWRVERIPRTELVLLALRGPGGELANSLVLDRFDAEKLARELDRASRRLRRPAPWQQDSHVAAAAAPAAAAASR